MTLFFAVIDEAHDVKDPLTVVRVLEGAGPYGITMLNDDAAWVRTNILDHIEAGEVPYRIRPIGPKAAARIRARREKGIAFRYSILVDDDDPDDKPQGVLREWSSSGGESRYAETYTRAGEWEHSNVRLDIERGSNVSTRIVPSDSSTVRQVIESWHREWD